MMKWLQNGLAQHLGLRTWKLLFGESIETSFKSGKEVFKEEVSWEKVRQLV